jgi:MFS family permease
VKVRLPREVFVLAAVAFCVALGFGIVAPAIPVFAQSFGVSAFWATAVISVFALVRLVSALPAGRFVDAFGERAVLTTGLVIVSVSSLLAGLSTSYPQLLLLRGVGGFGSAMFTVSSFGLLIRVVAPDIRARAAGAYQAGFLLGGIAGPAIGGLVAAQSVRTPFFVYAATLGAAAVVAGTMLAGTHLRDKDVVTEQPGWGAVRTALRSRPYVTALTANFSSGFAAFGLRSALVPLLVVNSLRQTPRLTGTGLVVTAVVTGALLWPAGRMSDLGGRRLPLVIGTGLTVLGLAGLALTHSPATFLASMAVMGAGAAFLSSAPAAIVADVGGGRRSGKLVATFQMSSDLGSITGPLIGGAIVTATGSYSAGFAVGAVVSVASFAMAVAMPETRRAAPVAADAPATDATATDGTGQTAAS